MTNKYKVPEEIISMGEREGILKLSENKVEYIALRKSYRSADPEEKIRAAFYVELITKYKYPKQRIDLEVIVPRRDPKDKADIVVYEDDDKKNPYIVVEAKKDGISPSEIRQAIEQVFGNANSLGAKYALMVAGNVRIAFDVANFPSMEREKNVIADIPIRYGKLIKFKFKRGDENWDLKEVTRDELLNKFQQCHDTLWEGGKRNPAEAFDEMSKLMFCKIHDERFLTSMGEYYKFQIGTHETIKEVADRIRKIYQDAQGIDPDVFIDPIKAEDPITYGVVEVLQGVSLSKTDLDAKGVAFEHFLGTVFRGEMGQYFTPRTIVEFMVDCLEPDVNSLMIDPACGSGGFLIYSLEKIKTDLEARLEPHDARDRWKDFALKQVFGIEINSQLARVSMMNMIIHEDGHTNIENSDALDNPAKFHPRRVIRLDKYTLLLTNPPFGAVVKERERTYLKDYVLGGKEKKRNRQNTEILFIERCLAYLRPGGRMGIVLPDGILTNSSLQYVRDFVLERAQILGVVSLPQGTFTHYGAGVKASLLFLRKKKEDENLPKNYPIFMAIAKHIGYDTTGRPDENEFPEILEAWRSFKKENRVDFFANAPLCFAIERGECKGRLDVQFYQPEYIGLEKQILSLPYPAYKLQDLAGQIVDGPFGTQLKVEEYVNEGIPVVRVSDVKTGELVDNNLVFITSEKHKQLIRSQVLPGDVILTKAGAILGYSAVFPDRWNEGNITSHSVTIRCRAELNPYYLSYYLRSTLGNRQVYRWGNKSTRPELNTAEVGELLTVVPPRPIQDKIANVMDEAYRIKKEKETEAESILNSIEEYVLDKLGIKLPQIKDERTFTVTADAIYGSRFDPFYYQPKHTIIQKAISGGKYRPEFLKNLIVDYFKGILPKFEEKGDDVNVLQIRNLTRHGDLDLSDILTAKSFYAQKNPRARLQKGDLIIVITGATIGKVAIYDMDMEFYLSGDMIRLRIDKSKANNYFIFETLLTEIGQTQIMQNITGATNKHLSLTDLLSSKSPLPPISIQEKIAEDVQVKRQHVKKLKQEAQELLQVAKEKAEQMILGVESA